MNHAPAPEGVAWFLRGAHRRISKNHDKGYYGIIPQILGIGGKCAIPKGNDLKFLEGFLSYFSGGVTVLSSQNEVVKKPVALICISSAIHFFGIHIQ
jgi:hypothetical protein